MTVADLLTALQTEATHRAYVRRLDLLELTPSLIKARLHVTDELFVQVYRNDRFDTTSLALIQNGQRLYGRDQLGGVWHRHAADAPDLHDTSPLGQRAVTLPEFLNEVENVLADLGLP
jgi:hypothetical protein